MDEKDVSDLNTMIPVVESVMIRGEEVPTPHIKVKQLGKILQSVAPIIGVLRKMAPNVTNGEEMKSAVMALFLSNPQELLTVVAIVIDKPVAWVEELELDDFLLLVLKIVEVNLDFFTQKLLPSVLQAMGQLGIGKQVSPSSGQMPFSI